MLGGLKVANKSESEKAVDVIDTKTSTSDVITVESNYDQMEDEQNVVHFTHKYLFEGKEISKVDLSGFDNLTAKDMIEAQKILDRSGNISFMPEMTLEYACIMASKATDIPQEFFYSLRPKDSTRLKNKVTAFFFGAE